jgi:hypothetical protein
MIVNVIVFGQLGSVPRPGPAKASTASAVTTITRVRGIHVPSERPS